MTHKAVKLRAEDHAAVAELIELVRAHGVGALPDVARAQIPGGVTAGSVIAASVALLRQHLTAGKGTRK